MRKEPEKSLRIMIDSFRSNGKEMRTRLVDFIRFS